MGVSVEFLDRLLHDARMMQPMVALARPDLSPADIDALPLTALADLGCELRVFSQLDGREEFARYDPSWRRPEWVRLDENTKLEALFNALDEDGDGTLNKAEYREYLKKIDCWGTGDYTDEKYDTAGWAEELPRLRSTEERGVDLRAFAYLYNAYRILSKDLKKVIWQVV